MSCHSLDSPIPPGVSSYFHPHPILLAFSRPPSRDCLHSVFSTATALVYSLRNDLQTTASLIQKSLRNFTKRNIRTNKRVEWSDRIQDQYTKIDCISGRQPCSPLYYQHERDERSIALFQGIVKSTDAEGENLGLYLLGKRMPSLAGFLLFIYFFF